MIETIPTRINDVDMEEKLKNSADVFCIVSPEGYYLENYGNGKRGIILFAKLHMYYNKPVIYYEKYIWDETQQKKLNRLLFIGGVNFVEKNRNFKIMCKNIDDIYKFSKCIALLVGKHERTIIYEEGVNRYFGNL